MKKRITALFLASTIVLAGCILLEAKQSGALDKFLLQDEMQTSNEETAYERPVYGKQEQEPVRTIEQEEESEETTENSLPQENLYHYKHLNEEEREVYAQIYDSVIYMKEEELSTTDTGRMEKVFQCVLNDHPEIFYVEGYTFTKYTRGDEITKIIFEAAYTMEKEEAIQNGRQIEEKAAGVLREMPQNADDYEKIKYIYEYIIENTEYSVGAEDNQNIRSVFINGQSVCQGYAKATQYLLQKAGIESTLVVGFVEGGEGHAWNLVNADGEYYYVDTTWGDASYRMTTEEEYEVNNLPVINYDYLCVTTEQLRKTHTIENVIDMPECVAVKDNYYVREGAYFTEVNEEQLTAVFEKSYAQGKDYVTLQCADSGVYKSVYDTLITEQKIFQYMDTQDSIVAYAQNEEQYSLSFWLSE